MRKKQLFGIAAGLAFVAMAVLESTAAGLGLATIALTGTLQFNGDEARTGIVDPIFKEENRNRYSTTFTNIKAKTQVIYLGQLERITKKDAGCNSSPVAGNIPATQKFWDPTPVEMFKDFCATEWAGMFTQWGLANGKDYFDLEQATLGQDSQGLINEFIMTQMSNAGNADLARILWFGDADAAAAPGGLLTNAGLVSDYDQITAGWWKHIFTGVTAGTVAHVPIAANAEASDDAQFSVYEATIENTYNIFKAMYKKMDARLASENNKFILATKSMVDVWQDYRESKVLESSFGKQTNGQMDLNFRGIPIIQMQEWDKTIKSDFDNGTTLHRPHRAVLTTKANLQAIFDVDGSQVFDSWYEKKEKKNYIRGGYRLDAQLAREFLTVAAY